MDRAASRNPKIAWEVAEQLVQRPYPWAGRRAGHLRAYGLLASGSRAVNIARTDRRPGQSRTARPRTARHNRDPGGRPSAHAAASLPLLLRTHVHHRDLHARLPAQGSSHTGVGSDQDRHLIMQSPPIRHRSDPSDSRRISTGRRPRENARRDVERFGQLRPQARRPSMGGQGLDAHVSASQVFEFVVVRIRGHWFSK
jgi:hypothetical protein